MWPDYHGNRSPLADPSLKGAVVGLSLNTDTASLATIYLATLQVGGYYQGGYDGRGQRSCKCNYVDFYKDARPPC